MVKTVFCYNLVQKKGVYGPLRVIGLAREEGHRICKARGRGSLREDGIKKVWLGGKDLEHRVSVDRPWQSLQRGCHLRVLPADEHAALSIVDADRAYITRMHGNIWDVDRPMEHGEGFHDLVLDYSSGSGGMDSVELKVRGKKDFAKKLAEDKDEIVRKFELLSEATALYSGIVLMVTKVSFTASNALGNNELLGFRWDGTSWSNWKPQGETFIRSPLLPRASLESALLEDSSAFVRYRSAEYVKVGKYLKLQNETDPSGRLTYWKSRGFVHDPEIEDEILRPSGASAIIHRGAGRPSFRLGGGSRGIFVKKTILKGIHIARLRGAL